MVISTSGSGERPLFVSYVSEVPIWKTTYRLVLREQGAKPLLQGWAIIDNTIGEDWTGVELSLKGGRWRNELTKYRYDVVLRVGGGGEEVVPEEVELMPVSTSP